MVGIRLSGTNLVRAADHNQRVTLHAIRVHGRMTRVDIARLTGLTAPAIANITKKLLADGLIEEVGRVRERRGQPATQYAVNRHACYALGLNIDRDHLSLALVNFMGEIVARYTCEVDYPAPDTAQAFYRETAPRLMAQAQIDPADLLGLGVAIPDNLGDLDLPGRPDDFAQWGGVDLAQLLAEPLDLPVFVENDAAAAAMGEQQLGLGRHFDSMFYILISRGLGGGLVVDGNYMRGAQGRSGEIGFLHYRDAEGGSQPVQALVSLAGLEQWLAQRGLGLCDLYAQPVAKGMVEAVDGWIAQCVQWLRGPFEAIHGLINPSAIVLSGRLPVWLLDMMVAQLSAGAQAYAGDLPAIAPIRRAALCEDAAAVGAAILPFSHFLLPMAGALWK
jgi:predicted NBD/HSP70 family sugar kinase